MKLLQTAKANPVITAILGTAGVMVALSQIGKFARESSYVVQAIPTAYAAKAQAEETASQFEQYLTEQRAYTKALNSYIGQQQAAPPIQTWRDPQGGLWCCAQECDYRDSWRRCDD